MSIANPSIHLGRAFLLLGSATIAYLPLVAQAQWNAIPNSITAGATEHRAFYIEACANPPKPLNMAQKYVCAESAEKAGIAPPGFAMRFRPGAGPQPALPPVQGDAVAGSSIASARDNVPGGRPISGSLVKLYSNSITTRAGHQVYGTEAGLACFKPARGQTDRHAELFELVCPAATLGCYLTAPDGNDPTSGRCSGGTSYPVSMSRGATYYGAALVRLPLSGKVSLFVMGYDQCAGNASLVKPLPDAWAAACDVSQQDLAEELKNNSPTKIEELHRQRWLGR